MSPSLAAVVPDFEQTEFSFSATDKPHALAMAAQALVAQIARGRAIDAATLRVTMEEAFGGGDAQGAWVWKDAHEAVEAAQVLFLRRFGAGMRARTAGDPALFLAMLTKIGGLLPTQTRRSEESHSLQQLG